MQWECQPSPFCASPSIVKRGEAMLNLRGPRVRLCTAPRDNLPRKCTIAWQEASGNTCKNCWAKGPLPRTQLCLTSERMDQKLCVKCVGSKKDLKDINHPRLTLYINVYIYKNKKYFSGKENFSHLSICIYVNTLWRPHKKKTILTQ